MTNKTAGYIVETQEGKIGRTYHYKGTINKKLPVYFPGEEKPVLFSRDKIKVTGYID